MKPLNLYIICLSLLLSIVSFTEAKADNIENSSPFLEYSVESRAAFAGGQNTPFWLVSNIHGLGAPQFNNGYVRGEIYKPMENKRFSWGAGADLTGAWNLPASFAVRQLFAEAHYRALWISIGSRNFLPLYNDIHLSSGDLLFSGNAMAIPQVRIGTNGYASVWGTKNWLAVRGYLAYGFFTDSNWQKHWCTPDSYRNKDVLFCGRGIWFKVGNKDIFPLTYEIGLEMGTQFGGTIYTNDNRIIKMPNNFIDWVKALVPLSGGPDTPMGEQTNVQGNTTGEYSMSTNFSLESGWNFRAYWEHFFEDHSQMTFEYGLWKDGLWGLEVTFPKNPFVSKFLYEYVATKDQTGAVNNDSTPQIPEQISGRDNYYNHYIYGCWQNWGMTLGTPLAISPLYNRDHMLVIYNTRFLVNHFGLEGNPMEGLKWRFLLTFSRNWGSYWYPLPDIMNNCSGLCEISYQPRFLPGLFAKGAIAWDHGPMLGNNFGGMITLGYQGSFSLKKK